MMKTISVNEAIELATKEESLEGFAIQHLGETQVKAKDALLLARYGILIPEQNILYRDQDVAHDSEFDDYEWRQLPRGVSMAELSKMSEEYEAESPSVFSIEIELDDQDALLWAKQNYPILKDMFNDIFRGFYNSKAFVNK